MKKWIVLFLVLSIVVLSGFQAQAASSRDAAEIAALEAKGAQLEAEIAKLKAQSIEMQKALKQLGDSATKDVGDRSRLNKGIGESVAQANKRLDSAEASDLALAKAQDLLAKRQGALEQAQYALAEKYDAAIVAAMKEAKWKNQIVTVCVAEPAASGASGTVNVIRAQNQERKTHAVAISRALIVVGYLSISMLLIHRGIM